MQVKTDEAAFINNLDRLQIGDFSLYYERTTPSFETIADETLPGTGLPLVFLHGMAGNHLSWWQQVPYFTSLGYQCFTLDQHGFGLSPDPDDLFCKAHGTDLARLLDHLKIDRSVLVGQSMGGWSIVGCALDRPERVAGLVLSGTPGGIVTTYMDERIRTANGRPELHGADASPLKIDLCRPRDRAFLYDQIEMLGAHPPDDAGSRLRAMNFSVDMAASQLKMPVLCVVGEQDDVFPPDMIRELTGILPDARLVTVPDCGHSVYFDRADAFNQLVRNFLVSIGYKG